MSIGCEEVQAALRLGDEGPDVLEHLAWCAACRAAADATVVVNGGDTERRPPATLEMPRNRTPIYVAVALVPLVVILAAVALLRSNGETSEVETRRSPPKVTPVAATAPQRHHLSIDARPPGRVFLDGVEAGATPFAADLAPGRVLVEVHADGFLPARKVLLVGDADPAPLVFALERTPALREESRRPERAAHDVEGEAPRRERAARTAEAPAPPPEESPAKPAERPAAPAADDDDAPLMPAFGYLTISTEPWAKVILDGKDIGRTTPLSRYTTPAGHHTVELRARTGSLTLQVNVKARQELTIDKTIE